MSCLPVAERRARLRARRMERGANWFVTLLILAALVAGGLYLYPRYVAPRLGGAPVSTAATADGATCASYAGQIRGALKQYNDEEGRNPPTLPTLNRYGVTKDMLQDSACAFHYDPITGFHDLSPGEGNAPVNAAPASSPSDTNQ
jgi:hypothetical protein